MAWRIEKAITDRSSCKHCRKRIAKNEQRFGKTGLNGGWYHLKCAAAGKPRVFASFKTAAAETKRPAKKRARNAELEADLVAKPDDKALRAVFADWLQSQGDPWGELIALELAGKQPEAEKLLKKHRGDLCGGFDADLFKWRGGFIDRIRLHHTDRKQQRAMLEKMFALRTAILVRDLELHTDPDARFVRFLADRAPKSVTSLFLGLTNALGQLALPQLVSLGVRPHSTKLDAAALAPLFAADQLPRLTRLSIYMEYGVPIPRPVLTALLDSQLVKQLESLVVEGLMDDEGMSFLRQQREKLAHIPAMNLGGSETMQQRQAWLELETEGVL
jgi:uncharacterized protein (TIGR02996 family)